MLRRFGFVLVGVLVSVVLGVAPASAFYSHVFSSSFGSQGSEAGQVSLAPDSGVAVNFVTHDVYVADTENARVDQFSSAGAFIRAWGWGVADGLPAFETCTLVCQAGIKGSAPGEFELPTLIAVDNSGGPSQGDVYVGDTGYPGVGGGAHPGTHGTDLVQKFTASGVLVAGWGVGGQLEGSTSISPAGPFHPVPAGAGDALGGVVVDQAGNLFVYDAEEHLFKFAQDGTPLTGVRFGTGSPLPVGMGVDSGGNFFVSDQNLVEKFSPAGSKTGPVNSSRDSGVAGFTSGLAVDPVSSDVYVGAEFGGVVDHYAASCDPSSGCLAVDSFGGGELSGAAGLAVDSPVGTVYVADAGNGRVDAFAKPPAVPPSIGLPSIAAVASTSVEMRTEVNPNLYDTHFHFQYVEDAGFQVSGFADAAVVPASDVDLGDGGVAVNASAHPQNLQPATTYHYRIVADNGNGGPQTGPAGTFTTQPVTEAFRLPDSRGYELVSPSAKGDGFIPVGLGTTFGTHQAASGGDAFAYVTTEGFPGSQAGVPTPYLASRGTNGWSSQGLAPPQATAKTALEFPPFVGYSADLSKAVLLDGRTGLDSPPLVNGEPANNENLFLRDNSAGSYQLLDLTPAGVTPAAAGLEGASADFSRIVFASRAQLTPDAQEGAGNLFEWAGGGLSLVSQIPVPPAVRCGGGGPSCSASPGAELGSGFFTLNAVSPDGSKVFFRNASGAAVLGQIYVREDGTRTVEVSASQKNNGAGPGGTDPNGPLLPQSRPSSPDGSKAFFTSCEQLTNDSTAVSTAVDKTFEECHPGSSGEDLYRFDTANGVLTDLTVDHTPGDVRGADVQGVLGSSADGSYVYFVANGVLASGASPGNCAEENGVPVGSCNLYLSHGGTTRFIAALNDSDSADWSQHFTSQQGTLTARVTPDGSRLAFGSVRSLTGYDNTVASGSHCGGGLKGEEDELFGAQCPEVFLYDAVSGVLSCASCNPTGARPVGPSVLDGALQNTSVTTPGSIAYLPRNLSEDGRRLFFDSGDALVPGDVNGRRDVYEYEGGRVYLISSGTSSKDSTFLDASLSGSDVFFSTSARLVGQDVDDKLDVYDARVGGGFPAPPGVPVSCVGEACKPAPSGGVGGLVLGSAGVSGVGNLAPPSAVTVGVRRRALSRAQKLAVALRACRREPRRRRGSCFAHARRLYGPVRAGKTSRRSGRGTK